MLAADPDARPRDVSAIANLLAKTEDRLRERQAARRRRICEWAVAIAACAALAIAAAVAMAKWMTSKNPVPDFETIYEIPANIR